MKVKSIVYKDGKASIVDLFVFNTCLRCGKPRIFLVQKIYLKKDHHDIDIIDCACGNIIIWDERLIENKIINDLLSYNIQCDY